MCFSSGSSQVKAKPANPLSRFDYNQPTTPQPQQPQPAPQQPDFGSELGGSTPEQRY